jgi:hypothetical protein|tara:strand:- start:620 stop:865 length:246 start_codon:yes stop_codon:yes gene_type:complete
MGEMMVLKEGPLKTAVENNDGVIKQELINYRITNGMLHKEVITRQFRSDGDYTDHTTTTPLVQVEMTMPDLSDKIPGATGK